MKGSTVQRSFISLVVAIIGYLIGLAITNGILPEAIGNMLLPYLTEQADVYVPLALAFAADFGFKIYSWAIDRRLKEAARLAPAGETKQFIAHDALGAGAQRTAAQILLGVK